jgi:hypothetical protein
MFANAVYIAFCTNKMRALQGTGFDNFPAIENYPETEESRAVAAEVRATVYSLLSETPQDWESYFWNRGLEIEPCDYDGVVRNDIRRVLERD